MKNLFIIPTDKPSRLYFKNGVYRSDIATIAVDKYISSAGYKLNIYITNSEEIKEGDWVYNIVSKTKFKATKQLIDLINDPNVTLTTNKKIILTTDNELIKDGVQSIDDTFLEWFVKNPSCESVEVKDSSIVKEHIWDGSNDGEIIWEKEIIIPKEELINCPKCRTTDFKNCHSMRCPMRKQETKKCICFKELDYQECCVNCESIKRELNLNCFDCDKSLQDCTCMEDTINVDNKETLEEVAETFVKNRFIKQICGDEFYPDIYASKESIVESHILFTKWQKEQDKKKYSEEDMREAFKDGSLVASWSDMGISMKYDTFEDWFKQHKKK